MLQPRCLIKNSHLNTLQLSHNACNIMLLNITNEYACSPLAFTNPTTT